MFKFSETYKRIVLIQLGLCLACFAIGGVLIPFDGSFVLADTFSSYALGMGLGYIFSCIKLFMMEKSLEKSMDMSRKAAAGYTGMMYMLRYMITFALLAAGALIKEISLLGLFISIILLQPAALIAGARERRIKEES